MEDSVNKRIRIIIKDLRTSLKGFCEEIGVSEHTFGTIFQRNSLPNTDIIIRIANRYPQYNLRWLLTGEGKMIREGHENVYESPIHDFPEKYKRSNINELVQKFYPDTNIYFIPLYLPENYQQTVSDEEAYFGKKLGYMPFVGARKEDIALIIAGKSMEPVLPARSFVHLRKVHIWKEVTEYGQLHFIVLKDGRSFIREIKKSSQSNHFLLKAYNDTFEDMEVDFKHIEMVWVLLSKYEKLSM